ncbi:MAG: ATP-binding protein [Candidatus Dojkabacteria bacterium]
MYRTLKNNLYDTTSDVLIIIGSRQVGKTTLLKNTFPNAIYVNTETFDYIDILNSRNIDEIKERFLLDTRKKRGKNKPTLLIIDEFQRLQDPGLIAKVIHDEIPEIKLIITGSSALELTFEASESLAGRKKTHYLFPLTFQEKLVQTRSFNQEQLSHGISFTNKDYPDFKGELLDSMRYGMYPETLNRPDELEEYLLEYVNATLLKDIYYLELVRNVSKLEDLLKLLAYQIGNQINVSEISNRLGIARQTVESYLDILTKTYIIFTLKPFTKKRRDEIGKTEKIYFYDLGVRNALINDFSPVEYRQDFGNILENFAISEFMKLNYYYKQRYTMYYWRTKWGSEVDLIMEKNNTLKAIEIKSRKGTVTSAFTDVYPQAECHVATLRNLPGMIL